MDAILQQLYIGEHSYHYMLSPGVAVTVSLQVVKTSFHVCRERSSSDVFWTFAAIWATLLHPFQKASIFL